MNHNINQLQTKVSSQVIRAVQSNRNGFKKLVIKLFPRNAALVHKCVQDVINNLCNTINYELSEKPQFIEPGLGLVCAVVADKAHFRILFLAPSRHVIIDRIVRFARQLQ